MHCQKIFFAATPCARFSFSYRANPVVDADLRNANILIDSLIDELLIFDTSRKRLGYKSGRA